MVVSWILFREEPPSELRRSNQIRLVLALEVRFCEGFFRE